MSAAGLAALDAACAAARAAGVDPAAVRLDLESLEVDPQRAAVAALERVAAAAVWARRGSSFVVRVDGRSVGFAWLEPFGSTLGATGRPLDLPTGGAL